MNANEYYSNATLFWRLLLNKTHEEACVLTETNTHVAVRLFRRPTGSNAPGNHIKEAQLGEVKIYSLLESPSPRLNLIPSDQKYD